MRQHSLAEGSGGDTMYERLFSPVRMGSVGLERLASGLPASVPADTVILALGVRPQTDVVDRFKSALPDARVVGDPLHGGRIVDATRCACGQAFVFEPLRNDGGRWQT